MSLNSKNTAIEIKKKDLAPIIKHINKYHEGDLLSLVQWLDRAVYMFHFLPNDDSVLNLQKQDICHVLVGLKETLLEVYNKNDREYYFISHEG